MFFWDVRKGKEGLGGAEEGVCVCVCVGVGLGGERDRERWRERRDEMPFQGSSTDCMSSRSRF